MTTRFLLILLGIVLVLAAGCGDDDDCVQCPADNFPNPTLENIWPNADQTAWTYAYRFREWEGPLTLYPTREDVPDAPLPTWTEVFNLVEAKAPLEPYTSVEDEYRLRFDGMTTTGPGVTAQNLIAEFLSPLRTSPADFRSRAFRVDGSPLDAPLLAPGNPAQVPAWPLLLGGGAWKKESQSIGLYGEMDQNLAWLYLTSHLSPGSEFSLPLLPWLSDEAALYTRVHRRIDVETPVGTFAKALDCLYIVDYGIVYLSDGQGQDLGYLRMILYGRVIYAPTIGPVYSYERHMVQPGSPPSAGVGDVELVLIELTAGVE